MPIEVRKNINALNFPMPPGLRPEQRFFFATNFVAWLRTQRKILCFAPYPAEHMRWGLVAYNGALHYLHIDADGFGTWLEVKCGSKLWVIARPRGGQASFSNTNAFVRDFKLGRNANTARWTFEAVVLKRGMRLVMAPNVPHAVWTLADSICHSSHFYSIAMLLPSVVGIVHTFIRDDDLTNTNHTPASRMLLRRILHFLHQALVINKNQSNDVEHLPNLMDPRHNVLDHRTYCPPDRGDNASVWNSFPSDILDLCDVNAIPHQERLENIYARGLALDLADWIFSQYALINAAESPTPPHPASHGESPYVQFYFPFLGHLTAAIQTYKQRFQNSVSHGCSLVLLEQQITFCVDQRQDYDAALTSQLLRFRAPDGKSRTRSIVPPFPFIIRKREVVLPFSSRTNHELTQAGSRLGDRLYLDGYARAVKLDGGAVNG
ncbi:hypothetical protein BKA70DRAFT_1428552 [Coprinopsis sp. MPI-PUGE-AT-0042]|nr:hypothetical protein BKA70DRAFT_1428552 [Coprinopsis sp. MPI-PUGE-AT-0042]